MIDKHIIKDNEKENMANIIQKLNDENLESNLKLKEKELESAIKIKEKEIESALNIKQNDSQNVAAQRAKWSSKYDYLLSAAGLAIGIGNVWRFPYLCYRNGGGAFLIPYLTMLLLVGIPIFFLETSIGQFSSSGCISLYKICPAFKGIGYTSVLTTLIASSYYTVVIAYPVVFFIQSFTSNLPWASCDHFWNTKDCILPGDNTTHSNTTVAASQQFFENKVLEMNASEGIGDPGSLVTPVAAATLFVSIFTFLCIFRGVNVLGKVVWFTATFPFVMLFILCIRGITLPGAWIGIRYYISPDFNKLLDLQVWSDAASQIIFSSGIGWGSLITLGSFNNWKNNTIKDAICIPILNCATSIFAGFVVFSVLGFMSYTTGIPIDKVTTGGPALAFITYPQAISLMPLAPLWAILFFAMLFFLGIDSLFVQTETIITALMDEFPKLKKYKTSVTLASVGSILLLALSCCTQGGIHVLNLLDTYSVPIPILTVCFCELCVFAYCYGSGKVIQDINIMTGQHVSEYWWIMWTIISPSVLLLMILNTTFNTPTIGEGFPLWAKGIGWLSALIPLSTIPMVWIYQVFFKAKGDTLEKKLESSHTSTSVWGPRESEHYREWKTKKLLNPIINNLLMPDYLKSSKYNQTQRIIEETPLTDIAENNTTNNDKDSIV